jgi:hypothetical protein
MTSAPVTGARATGARAAGAPVTATLRLLRLHAVSRRVPVALALIAAIGVGLRLALIGHWDAYGALQLPLVGEAACAAVIAVSAASPLGEPERVAGRWLPLLRFATNVLLTAVAVAILSAAGIGATLAGGTGAVTRNLAGITGIGLLCAVVLGGGLAWTGPLVYLVAGVYALYTDWHGPAIPTPWLWPARPPGDAGGAACAIAAYAAGVLLSSLCGARDRREE